MKASDKTGKKKEGQAFQKVINYLEYFIESEYFQQKVKELRIKFNIPAKGLPLTEKDVEKIKGGCFFYFPLNISSAEKRKTLKLMNIEIKKILKKIPLNIPEFQHLIKIYVFHDKLVVQSFSDELKIKNLIKIVDLRRELLEYNPEDPTTKDLFLNHMKDENMFFPIAIRVSPLVSKRDILDYVEKNWPEIETLKFEYLDPSSKLGKIRKADPENKERNKIIYKNRDLKIKEIRKMLAKKGIFLDDGHIAKLRSNETKRRKEV